MMLAGAQKNQINQQRCKEEASGGQERSGGLRRGAGRGQERIGETRKCQGPRAAGEIRGRRPVEVR
jgi:hypothetical protein